MANKTGSNRNRKGISKDGISKMVLPPFDAYIADGGHFGHDTDHQKEEKKKWYNNGIEQHAFKLTDRIPEGYVEGMLPVEPGRYSKFEYKWYTNGKEQKRLSLLKGDIIPEGGGEGQSDEMAEKSRKAAKGSKRTDEQIEHHKVGAEKAGKIKLENGTFNTSQPEEKLYSLLCDMFGEDNIERQYNKDERYPWHCDFYVRSNDLFIELNIFPTHGTEPFDETNEEHLKLLEKYKSDPESGVESECVKCGAGIDVKKRTKAKENNLNFIEFYNRDERQWYNTLSKESIL